MSAYEQHLTRPCPACPDGSVWSINGPTGKTCPVCNGHAEVNMDGSPIGPKREKRK